MNLLQYAKLFSSKSEVNCVLKRCFVSLVHADQAFDHVPRLQSVRLLPEVRRVLVLLVSKKIVNFCYRD